MMTLQEAIEIVDTEPSIDINQAGNINVKLYELRQSLTAYRDASK